MFDRIRGVVCQRAALLMGAGAVSALALTGCGSEAPTHEESVAEPLITQEVLNCQTTGNCSIDIPVVNGANSQETVVIARKNLTLEDDTKVLASDGTFKPVVNSGDGLTVLGSRVTVGKIVSQASTLINPGSTINGDVISASTVTTVGSSTITGRKLQNESLGTRGSVKWPIAYPQTSSGDRDTSFSTVTIAPGRYGRIHIGPHGTLKLTSGAYYLETLDVDDGAQVNVDNAQGLTVIYARNLVTFEGAMTQTGDPGNLVIGYLGALDVIVRAPAFQGTVVAPNAWLHLGSSGATVAGVFSARNVTLERGTTAKLMPATGGGTAGDLIVAQAVITNPSGGGSNLIPPTPTFWGNSTKEWANIWGAWVKGLLDGGYAGPTIVTPTPAFGLDSAVNVPTPAPATVIAGPGGLTPIDADVGGLNLGADDGPGPSANNVHFQYPGDGPYFAGSSEFGGGFFFEGDADANQLRQLGFYTHTKMTLTLSGSVLDAKFDAGKVVAYENTETEHAKPDGTSEPRAEIGADIYLGPLKVASPKLDKVEKKTTLYKQEQSLLPPGVPPPIPILGFLTLQAGAKGAFTVELDGTLDAKGPMLKVTPKVTIGATLSVTLNAFIATVEVEGTLNLFDVSVPVDVHMAWDINELPNEQPGDHNCQANIDWNSGFQPVFKTLSGDVRLKVKAGVKLLFIDARATIVDTSLYSFNGVGFANIPYVSFIPSGWQGIKSFPLDQEQCKFGGLMCAKAAFAAETFVSWSAGSRDTSTTVGGQYGQPACKDQYLVEWDLTGGHPGVLTSGSFSTPGIDPAECSRYTAVLTVYGMKAANGQWEVVDQLNTAGKPENGLCNVQIQLRRAPASTKFDSSTPYSLVPDDQQYGSARAAIHAEKDGVKVPIQFNWIPYP